MLFSVARQVPVGPALINLLHGMRKVNGNGVQSEFTNGKGKCRVVPIGVVVMIIIKESGWVGIGWKGMDPLKGVVSRRLKRRSAVMRLVTTRATSRMRRPNEDSFSSL